jgi:AraC-like DNA-binding protein
MTLQFDRQKIREALQDFYNATGIDMELLLPDFSPADPSRPHNCRYCDMVQSTNRGKEACHCSDISLLEACKATGQAQMQPCHAGLLDVAMPIVHDDGIIGYISFGRMKPAQDFAPLTGYLSSLGLDSAKMAAAFAEIPFFDAARIRSVSNIATLLVKYILLENLLQPGREGIHRAESYIRRHLAQPLSIQDIARGTGISKSVLYKAFHRHHGCTLGAFVNACRVEASLPLLRDTTLSMEDISQRVGFSSASYYSKTFKKQMGQSPLQYRKNG